MSDQGTQIVGVGETTDATYNNSGELMPSEGEVDVD